MNTPSPEGSPIIKLGTEWIERNSSRRGFLAKAGAILGIAALGVLGTATAAEALPTCCSGTDCGNCPGAIPCNPTNLKCPAGYTQYAVTSCCNGTHTAFCRRCTKTGVDCKCGCVSQAPC